jgi:AcrR family transcriptional regulator
MSRILRFCAPCAPLLWQPLVAKAVVGGAQNGDLDPLRTFRVFCAPACRGRRTSGDVGNDCTDQTSTAAAVTRLVADDENGVGPVARRERHVPAQRVRRGARLHDARVVELSGDRKIERDDLLGLTPHARKIHRSHTIDTARWPFCSMALCIWSSFLRSRPDCDGCCRSDTLRRCVRIVDDLTPLVNTKGMAHEKTEHVIAAARKVFLRYGYRRVTMGDLAEAAQMSRPALYLVFPSKEQIFTEVASRSLAENFDEIRKGIPRFKTVEEKLAFAFEVWSVRGFELMQTSPDAADLLESSYEFAAEVTTTAAADFEGLLADQLEPLLRKQTSLKLSPLSIARILRTSAHGFKSAAKNSADLRQLISDMCPILLLSIRKPTSIKRSRS